MITQMTYNNKTYCINLNHPLDISIPLSADEKNPTAWYVDAPVIEPVKGDGFVGDVNQGGSVNFRNIFFNPHGHGTHTECVGHISKENYSINQCLKTFFFKAKVVSIQPEQINDDEVITTEQLEKVWSIEEDATAIVIRTLPNLTNKLNKQYSDTNPAFIDSKGMEYLVKNGVKHLLIDTPSVDKEKDEGKLLSHHVFWDYPANIQTENTITELIYVPENIADGHYFLNLQIASFENDASPSKPILYEIIA